MGFVQGGTVIRDGDNLKIQGVTPAGIAAQGNVIWREAQPWQFLLTSTTSAGIAPATPPVDTTDANLLVFYSTRVTTATDYTISDSADNIWAQGVSKDYGAYTSTVFYCIHPQTSQQHIFRVNSSSFTTVIIAAFKTPSVISSDQQSAIGVSSAASVQLPTIIPAPNSLVITSLTAGWYSYVNINSLDSSFLIVGQVPQTSQSALQAIAYAVADAVPIAPTWTISLADQIIATMMSFKP